MKAVRRKIIIVGTGHLAAGAGRAFADRGFAVSHITGDSIREASQDATGPSLLEHLEGTLRKAGSDSAAGVLVLDDQDSYNIRFALAAAAVVQSTPIIVSLFNEVIASQLQSAHQNLRVLSPARIAAPAFAKAVAASRLGKIPDERRDAALRRRISGLTQKKHDWMLYALVIAFVVLMGGSIMFFHWSEHLGWIDAAYFVATIISTVGFGDISLSHSMPIAKIYGGVLMLLSLGGVWMTFTLIMDRLMRRRVELSLGRKRYGYSGHVIVCGLGRVGYAVAEELARRGERVILVQNNMESRFIETVRSQGIDVYIGDARLPKTLLDVGIDRADVMVSAINGDEINLEIGLNARTLRRHLPLVLRLFDHELVASVRDRLHIPHALSTSSLMAEHLVRLLEEGS